MAITLTMEPVNLVFAAGEPSPQLSGADRIAVNGLEKEGYLERPPSEMNRTHKNALLCGLRKVLPDTDSAVCAK